MARPKKGGLGKGLEALFADNTTADVAVTALKITEIEPNQEQPRREFSHEALAELADSIREHGVLQPLVVRPRPNGRYQIVAGERRWRASRMAGLEEVPVVVKELSDNETLEIALVENLIREDLNPIEEALGYRSLMESFGMTQDEVARRVGRSRPAVANALRLLSLPEEAARLLKNGDLSAGHARALLPLGEKDAAALAKRIVGEGLSVRETERLSKALAAKPKEPAGTEKPRRNGYCREMELALAERLGRRVKITESGSGKGEITIEFYSLDELKSFGEKLAGT